MTLSVFTDEISSSVDRALELAAAWGLSHVEIRSIGDGRFPRVPDSALTDLGRQVEDAGLRISAVSPGFFKCALEEPEIEAGISEGLPRACEWALKWGTRSVSGFAFSRGEGSVPSMVVDYLGRMADVVDAAGCRLLLENEAACWGDTGLEAADIIRQVGAERLGLCWDPGNTARAGGDPAAEYQQVRDLVEHVHMKNYDRTQERWAVMDQGVVDWPGLIRSLRADGYGGFLILETHTDISTEEFVAVGELAGKEANTLHNLKYVRGLLEDG